MIDPLINTEDDAATPLIPEERAALIPTYIMTRAQLNEAEQIGIDDATLWAFSRKKPILTQDFLKSLHKKMFGGVWKWAGEFRTTDRNIGVDPWHIEQDLHTLLDDVHYWIEHKTYSVDEIAVRFHHRLVFIHPFPNGNGRHSRLAADLLITQIGGTRFTWGGATLVETDELRKNYIAALRRADKHDIDLLLKFARE